MTDTNSPPVEAAGGGAQDRPRRWRRRRPPWEGIRAGELRDPRPDPRNWVSELDGLRKLLSAADELVTLGHGMTLYAMPARWRPGVGSTGPSGWYPSHEMLQAQDEILAARKSVHAAGQPISSARRRLEKIDLDHDQPVWPDRLSS